MKRICAARLVDEQLFASGFVQGGGLQWQVPIDRRNWRITDQRLSRFSVEIGVFGKIELGTDFGKTKPACRCQTYRMGRIPALRSLARKPGR
ncbi:hypothetical protein [Sphingomonas sp. ZB1N12]|uniref:hypothetical protein n=1 Tax=Sphingomonas arabinosi TaxID=3096160 RepID=UPI003FA72568